jgi:hypothetical protein
MEHLTRRVIYLLLSSAVAIAGCDGDKGDHGPKGDPGINGVDGSTGTDGTDGVDGRDGTPGANGRDGDAGVSTAPLSITLVNAITNAAIVGGKVALTPSLSVSLAPTDAEGKTAATLPVGVYTLSLSASGYTTAQQTANLVAGVSAALTIKLTPVARVVANAGPDITGKTPGSSLEIAATSAVFDGSTGAAYSWTQTEGPPATLANANAATVSVTLPTSGSIKTKLVEALHAPVRTQVLGVNPYAIEHASIIKLTLTVTTSSGKYTDDVSIATESGFKVTSGLRNVPFGVQQLLQGTATKADGSTATSWSWSLNTANAQASKATIDDPGSQYPTFTPDVAGSYVLSEAVTGTSITLYAGKWSAAIGSLNPTDGLPDPPQDTCALCHNGQTAMDEWKLWRKSGHAQIFRQNIDDPANHWSVGNCASCHTVGYDTSPSAANDGFDDYAALSGWTQPAGAAGNYAAMFKTTNSAQLKVAGLANVQCDNCHGPTNSLGHSAGKTSPDTAARASLGAEVCAQCHGEPLRHGRFQQWQESGHANSELALEEGPVDSSGKMPTDLTATNNNANHCGRCHSAEGYMAWLNQSSARGLDFNAKIQGASGDATVAELIGFGLTRAMVHPQTCATCHDPHGVGDTSGEPNTATVRIQSDIAMLPAGFGVTGMGKGAICATCHNSRNGLHTDAAPAPTSIATPHSSSQTDVLMGQNAYFVTAGQRGGHSYLTNTCTNCHMELTPPPEEYSYNLTGTNHSFAADMTICASCHGSFDGGSLQASMKTALNGLNGYVLGQVIKKLNGQVLWVRATSTTSGLNSSSSSSSSNVKLDLSTATGGDQTITSVALTRTNLTVTLKNAMNVTWTDGTTTGETKLIVALSSIKLDDGTGAAPLSTAFVTPTSNLAKAIWNSALLSNDASLGIHNPSFYNNVIAATMAKDLTQ